MMKLKAKSSRKVEKAVLRAISKYVYTRALEERLIIDQRQSYDRNMQAGMHWLACGQSWGIGP